MNRGRSLYRITALLLATVLAAGCSSLPGLRVLTGQTDAADTSASLAVEALDLVMADKSGSTDPALSAAADRIEAANSTVDIIEMRKDEDLRIFTVNLLFTPPQTDTSTAEGQLQQMDFVRRAFETTWLGMMRASEGTDVIEVRIVVPVPFPTLDHGDSLVGFVVSQGRIDRTVAADYLAGARSLDAFEDLIVTGAFEYQRLGDPAPYEGTPNHPMVLLSAAQ